MEAATMKALALDDTLAEVHHGLAALKWVYYRDWPGAEIVDGSAENGLGLDAQSQCIVLQRSGKITHVWKIQRRANERSAWRNIHNDTLVRIAQTTLLKMLTQLVRGVA